MTKEDVREKMKEKAVVLLDVGSEENYLKLHIKGSLNQPLGLDRGFFAQEVERKFGKNKFFITYGLETAGIEKMNASQILEEKGFVGHVEEGRQHRFHALIAETAARRNAVRHLVGKLFRGSSELLFTQLVADSKLTAAQIRRLRRILDGQDEE